MQCFINRGGSEAFLSNMRGWYPNDKFNSVRFDFPSVPVSGMTRTEHRFKSFLDRIAQARDTSTIAGMIMMYGYLDGRNKQQAEAFCENFQLFVSEVRVAARNPTLPVFIDRAEYYATDNGAHWRIVDSIKNYLPFAMSHVYLFPYSYMPSGRMQPRDHHYDTLGHILAGNQLATMVQMYGEDWWVK